MQNTISGLEEILTRIQSANRLRKITIGMAMVLVFGLLISKIGPYPEKTFLEILVILLLWFLSIFIFEFLVRKQKTFSEVSDLYLDYEIIEFLFLSWLFYDSGGIEWIGVIFFIFVILYGNIILDRLRGFITTTAGCVFYTFLVVLQYFGLIPFKTLYVSTGLYLDRNYLLLTIPFVWFAFYLLGWAAGLFTDTLRKRNLELGKTRAALEESKTILEIKVRARTRELRELAESQKERIKRETKELRQRLKDLEKFQKLTVGRELKMIELKKRIKELEKK